jgi:hypothetical protein
MWKQFWFQQQKYHTYCLRCISAKKEKERITERGPTRDWGPIMLHDASTSILSSWHAIARQNMTAKDANIGKMTSIDISDDDEEEDVTFAWTQNDMALTKETSTLATLWLRTARSRIQARSNSVLT